MGNTSAHPLAFLSFYVSQEATIKQWDCKHAVCVMSVIYSQCACHSNIDVRIQQAELEYQLGREELNLLTLMEESRNLQICLEDAEQNRTKNDASTIYRYVS